LQKWLLEAVASVAESAHAARSAKLSAVVIRMSKNLLPTSKESWANIMNESSEKKRKVRHATRRARGEVSKTASPVKHGDTKMVRNVLKIYSTRPVTGMNGRTTRGQWVTAVDPEGDYGGPYASVNELLNDPKFRSNMNNIYGKRNAPSSRSRSRSRSGSRSGSRGRR
jgi:hypothetical protein